MYFDSEIKGLTNWLKRPLKVVGKCPICGNSRNTTESNFPQNYMLPPFLPDFDCSMD